MTDNIVNSVDKLSEFEKAFLCRLLNEVVPEMQVHQGTLPFVTTRLVRIALRSVIYKDDPTPQGRKASAILIKLNIPNTVKSQIALDDYTVFSRTRGTGHTGRLMLLRSTKKVGAGIKWEHFGKKWVKPETIVRNQAVLSRVHKGLWEVECDAGIAEITKTELFYLYGNGSEQYKRLRK